MSTNWRIDPTIITFNKGLARTVGGAVARQFHGYVSYGMDCSRLIVNFRLRGPYSRP